MSRKGCSPDNATWERLFGILKGQFFIIMIGAKSQLKNSENH